MKSETSLFPPTLKVEAYKLVSDFDFEAQGEIYGCFVILMVNSIFLSWPGLKLTTFIFCKNIFTTIYDYEHLCMFGNVDFQIHPFIVLPL